MPDESKPLVKITQWQGLASNAEARHLPPGAAQIQRNFQTIVPGRLTCRKGLQPTAFGTFKAGSDVIGLYTYQVHGKDYVIYEATDNSDDADGGAGTIMAGEGSTLIELVTDYFNDAFRVSFAKSRHNSLIMVNGIDRGKMWDGNDVGTGKAVELGIDPPASNATVGVANAANEASGATNGDYVCYYRYVDRSGAPLYSNLSPVRELTNVTAGRQFNWTGMSASFQDNNGSGRVRFVELYRSTAGQSTTVYLIKKIGYDGSITAIDSGSNYTITSKDHGLIVGSVITISGIVASGGTMEADLNTSSLEVTAVTTDTFTITDASSSGTYTSGGVWTLTGFGVNGAGEDAAADSDLNAAAVTTPATALRILNPDGTLNANRHTVPPFHMSVAVQFQDRMFYAVPVKLDEGTCSTNSNTTINVFSNTINSTVTDYSALKDRYITILDGNNEPLPFKITAQPDKVSVTVDRSAKKTATLRKYVIEAAPTERRKVYYSEADLPESVPIVNDTIVQENTGDDDDMTGLMPHGSYLYGLFERHIYRMSFVRQPKLDIQWTLVASRGCFNQACWDRYADLAFLMDQSGPYIVTLISPVPKVIGEEVQDLWRDADIKFANSKWFFTKVDPLLQVCRFYYVHKDDFVNAASRPKRAIVYHWPSGAWWEETYPIELGGATTVAIAGQLRTVVGGEDELVLLTHEKTIDIVTAEIRNNVESSTSTVLTDTGVFGSDDSKIGAPVAIISGTGKGQIRTITDNDANTITTAAWTKTPDTTSTYLVGAIEYQFKSGLFEFPVTESRSQRKLEIIFGTTAGADTMELRHYLDNSSTAVTHTPGQNKGDGVTIDNDTLHPVVDLKLTRSGLGDQPGFAHIMFSGNRPEDTQAARFIAAEVHGFQGASEIVLSEMSVGGAS